MATRPSHKQAITGAAARLFRSQGYNATGMADIIAASGAPAGSVYHYFPGGKAEIGAHAVTLAGEVVRVTLAQIAAETDSPAALIRRYSAKLAVWMEQSGWTQGCPIATVLLETAPADPGITKAGQAVLGSWQAIIAECLVHAGAVPARAASLAGLAVAATEGALIQARVSQSSSPIIEAGEEIAGLFALALRS